MLKVKVTSGSLERNGSRQELRLMNVLVNMMVLVNVQYVVIAAQSI